MKHTATRPAGRRHLRWAGLTTLALIVAACGSSGPASTAPSVAPSVAASAPAAPAASAAAASAPAAPSAAATTATGSGAVGADAAAGLTIDAPYALTALPAALQQVMQTQLASGLGASGGLISIGFRQIDGGTGSSILMVMGFPSGTLNAAAYAAALGGMSGSLGATFTTSTVDGIDVSSGKAATGGMAIFQVEDHMLVVISPSDADALPIAKALISSNK
ncbi:MAG: hypothetical protein ABIZ72_04890 [Candidatus Limnocylindrales bacterium]